LMKKLANKHKIPFYHLRPDNKNLLRKEVFLLSRFFEEDINITSIILEMYFSIRQFI